MKQAIDYIDELKKMKGFKRDSELARLLGITRGAVNNYRAGVNTPDDVTAEKIGRELGIEPAMVVFAAQRDRAKTPEGKQVWEDFTRRLGQTAAKSKALILTLAVAGLTAATGLPGPVKAAVHFAECILC